LFFPFYRSDFCAAPSPYANERSSDRTVDDLIKESGFAWPMKTLHKAGKIAAGMLLALFTAPVWAEWALNMTEGVTPFSREVFQLHMIILTICVLIGAVVFGAMIISIVQHRKSRGAEAAQFHESTNIEIMWTIIPLLILVAMAIPATKTLLAMEDTSDSDMTVKITGFQWQWKYDYVEEGISFISSLAHPEALQVAGIDPWVTDDYLLDVDNMLVLPVNTKVRFLITADDVIHSWWVPKLGWKRDAIPGFINEAWTLIDEPGIYRGQCAELCGMGHGFMPIVVAAVSEDDWIAWVEEQAGAAAAVMAAAGREWAVDELIAHGEEVYAAQCAVCHQPTGLGIPGAFPALAGSPVTTGPIEAHMDVVMNGRAGTAMQAFSALLNDVDLAAVITFERNAWGNAGGDAVQPSEITAKR
jgi:cytochrome c oxidase subunit 2